MKRTTRISCFARRNTWELLRDPITVFFGLAFPLILLLLMTLIQANIPVNLFEIRKLAPGVAVFGQSFLTLFSAFLISKDRGTAFLARLCSTPMQASDFLLGYLLPLVPLAFVQEAAVYAVAVMLGLPLTGAIIVAMLVGLVPALLFISVGLLCGTMLNDRQVGGICGALMTNVCAWLSGVWFDVSLLGGAFGAVCRALPFYHAVEACRAAINGQPGVGAHLLIVLAYSIVLMILAVFIFARRMKTGKIS